ncbi:aldose 1-epimerase family protein [Roseiconus nitratireducens]|uniref:Aldose 1-epimerase family protein n=1 Tax=Roseiconus nitratireducens TaxID=2605748 RepID=A0A5M6D0E2_9BACT|nr:aldose 1-epimerase family protein [Roseiconus nitratireducens]KAA5540951.1 aldose 1-epimerase family protein [Roseiconus nitratireducens]
MTKTIVARTARDPLGRVQWDDDSPLSAEFETEGGAIRTRFGRFVGGRSDATEIVRIDTGAAVIHVLPTRGMAIWNIERDGTRFAWRSPVDGPVHPSFVPLGDADGLGWLSGFDELLVRCGLESNGAPEHDPAGNLVYPLHGRIGNLPADGLQIEYDEASGRLELVGDYRESRLFFTNFHLRSRVRVTAGSASVEVLDDVTNDRGTAATMQMLYHINLGAPVLDDGSQLLAPIEELAPKDDRSASEIDGWNQCGGPQKGYAERVYFATLREDRSHQTTVMLRNAEANKGLAVEYSTKTLPRFILWKNTADLADGYVCGMEPATNYPNQRSFEENQRRLVELQPEETVSFRLTLEPLTDAEAVEAQAAKIQAIAGDASPTVHRQPKAGWSAS